MMKFKKPYAFLVAGLLCVATGVGIYNAGPSVEPIKAAEGESYTKVSENLSDWSGNYLIVYESNATTALVFDGSLTKLDAKNDYVEFPIDGGTISGTDLSKYSFTIEVIDSGYSIKSASGYYIYNTSDANALKTDMSTTGTNEISYNGSDVDIISSSAHLRFNSASDEMRFRYYKSTTYTRQKAIQLYKLNTVVIEDPYVNINGESSSFVGSSINLSANPKNFTGTEFTYAWSVAEDDAQLVSLTNETTSEVTVNLLKEGTATINLTVTSGEEVATASIDVTISSVLTVSEAKLLKDDTTTYVRGIVYAQYGDSFYIADEDGTGMQLFTYNDLGIAVGEEVVVTGTISTYNEGKQLNNPEIITHEVSDKVVTPKTVTYNDLENSLVNDYILIEDMVWHSGAASATNIYFYENGNSSNELVLYNHSSNSADYEGALTTAMSTWQQDVTTVTLAGVYGVFKDTLEIFLTSATTYEVDKVNTFARSFIANLTCDPSGQTAPSVEEWNTLAEEFALLSEEEKALFKQETSDNELINDTTEKYDYILGKYTDETYTNFMERAITPSPVNSGLAPVFNQTNNIIIIVSVCLLSLTIIAVFMVIYKKRKEIKK